MGVSPANHCPLVVAVQAVSRNSPILNPYFQGVEGPSSHMAALPFATEADSFSWALSDFTRRR